MEHQPQIEGIMATFGWDLLEGEKKDVAETGAKLIAYINKIGDDDLTSSHYKIKEMYLSDVLTATLYAIQLL